MVKGTQAPRKIPAVGRLLESASFSNLIDLFGHGRVAETLREILDMVRRDVMDRHASIPSEKDLATQVKERLQSPLRRVVNATGILIHTHLGRSPLPLLPPGEMEGYSTLEMDLSDGSRGDRNFLTVNLLKHLTGAQAGLVVNNNAAAVFLMLKTWCEGREVLVSRGELVEIGGSFRVPEILRESGAILREVGTTNRTHLRDFHDAMGERTSAILRTHPSNYRIQGFTSSPSHTELASLAADHGIHYFVDQGCGIVSDLRSFGVQDEPTVREIVNSGADAVCFSGDKLLGGPQAGIIVGKKTILDKMHKHPLFRTFRPGKETYHFLTRVLEFHLSGRTSEIPLYGMALTSLSKLRRRGRKIFKGVTNPLLSLAIVSMDAQFGGGTTPLVNLPSLGIEVMPPEEKEESLFTHLLHSDPPVVATHREGRVFLNLLSVNPNQINDLVRALNSYQ